MKKIFLTTIGILMLLACVITPVRAQDNNELLNTNQTPSIEDVDGLRAEFKQYMQDPETKNIKFEMILKSTINSDRVKVTWTIKGDVSLFVDENLKAQSFSVKKGETYTIPIVINTTGIGITELQGKAEAFGTESTYLVTITKNIISNTEGEVASSVEKKGNTVIINLPDDYLTAKTLMYVKNAALILGIVILALVFGLIGVKKFIQWLNKEDQVKYSPELLEQQAPLVVPQK